MKPHATESRNEKVKKGREKTTVHTNVRVKRVLLLNTQVNMSPDRSLILKIKKITSSD